MGGENTGYEEYIKVVNAGLDKLPRRVGTVWRGERKMSSDHPLYNAIEGDEITYSQMMSTSDDIDRAMCFSSYKFGMLLEIVIPEDASSQTAVLESGAASSCEKEILLKAGTRFRVETRRKGPSWNEEKKRWESENPKEYWNMDGRFLGTSFRLIVLPPKDSQDGFLDTMQPVFLPMPPKPKYIREERGRRRRQGSLAPSRGHNSRSRSPG